jgi:hypothetical protein
MRKARKGKKDPIPRDGWPRRREVGEVGGEVGDRRDVFCGFARVGWVCSRKPFNPQPLIYHLTNRREVRYSLVKVLLTVSLLDTLLPPEPNVYSLPSSVLSVPSLVNLSLTALLTYSCRLFVTTKNFNSFKIKQIQTLSAKHPGWGASATTPRTLRLFTLLAPSVEGSREGLPQSPEGSVIIFPRICTISVHP